LPTKIDGPQKYKWTSFDFETLFTRSFRSLPPDLKDEFAKYAKIYMVVIMFVTISYSFRQPRHIQPDDEIQKIKNIIKEKLTSVYHIDFNVIVGMLTFFDDFKLGGKYWDYEIFTRKHNPESNLTHYAGEYFGADFLRDVVIIYYRNIFKQNIKSILRHNKKNGQRRLCAVFLVWILIAIVIVY